MRRASIVFLLGICSACSWSLNDTEADQALRFYLVSSQPQPNGSLSVVFDWWDPVPDNRRGYPLEGAVGSGAFQQMATLGVSTIGNSIVLGPNDRAGVYQFRLRTPSGRLSKPVTVKRDPTPPTIQVTPVSGGFQVDYAATAQLPDEVDIARSVLRADGTATAPATLVKAIPRSGSYLDTDLSALSDGASYVYTATVVSGGLTSAPANATTPKSTAAAPQFTSVTQTQGGLVHLEFKSNSAFPGALRLDRVTGVGLSTTLAQFAAHDASQTFTFDDQLGSPNVYHYQLSFSIAGNFALSTSQMAHAVLPPSGWKGSIVDLPPPLEVARASNGAFALLADVPSGSGTVRKLIPPGLTAAEGFAVPPSYHPNALVLDAADHPHAVYADGRSVVHAFHDGQAWHTEVVAAVSLSQPADAAFGADGDLWAAWVNADQSIAVAHRSQSAWSVEQLPALLTATTAVIVAADETSAPSLAGGDDATPLYYFRDSSGWHTEPLPKPSGFTSLNHHAPQYMRASTTKVTVLDRLEGDPFGADEFDTSMQIDQRTSAGWTFSAAGGGIITPAFRPYFQAAIAPDQSTVSIAEGNSAMDIGLPPRFVVQFPQSLGGIPFGTGFEPSGTVWALFFFKTADGKFPAGGAAAFYEQAVAP